jgi:dephospho-CoA kinase
LLIIGITGNIACGKSTVDAILVELGATAVFDADQTVHDLLRTDPTVHERIVDAFGSAVLAADGSIDRRKLGDVVFADAMALRRLEGILHPAVRARIRAQVAALPEDALVVIDAVKLLEGDLGDLVTSVWWVTARPEQQLERLVRVRGMDEAAARARLAAQPPLARYRDRVQVIIDNSGSMAETHSQVSRALEHLRAAHVQDGPSPVHIE